MWCCRFIFWPLYLILTCRKKIKGNILNTELDVPFLLILFENWYVHYWKYSQMKNGERWPPGRMLQGRPKRTFHQRDSWWWGGHISNWIPCTLLHAELDFSRGIWAAARDGEEDRIKHLLSRFPNATHCHPIILNCCFFCAYLGVKLYSYSYTPNIKAAMKLTKIETWTKSPFSTLLPKGHWCQPERQWGFWSYLCPLDRFTKTCFWNFI